MKARWLVLVFLVIIGITVVGSQFLIPSPPRARWDYEGTIVRHSSGELLVDISRIPMEAYYCDMTGPLFCSWEGLPAKVWSSSYARAEFVSVESGWPLADLIRGHRPRRKSTK